MDGLSLPIGEADVRYRRISSTRLPNRPSRWRRLRQHLPFVLVVVLPTLATTGYLCFFASFQYVSEARFVVRGPSGAQPGMISSLLQGAGVTRAEDDTFAVQDYILSRDALGELVRDDDIRAVFNRPEADPLSRFPIWHGEESFEHLYKYYLNHVDVEFDSATGISKLTVRSFRADDSERIAQALLRAGEDLINRMNDRQRENSLRLARKEVASSETKVQNIGAQIALFRNRETLLDPNRQSVPMLAAIADLQSKLTSTRLQITELLKASPNSPLIAGAQRRAVALQAQIDEQRAKVAGSDQSLVPKITEFDRLNLDREFAEKELASATGSLETARIDAERQQLYLDPIVQPNKADYPAYPKRIVWMSIVFASCFGIYLMGKLLIAGAREHKSV